MGEEPAGLCATPSSEGTVTQPASAAVSKKDQRRERAASRGALAQLKKQVKDLEQQLERATADLQKIEQTLADETTYSEMTTDELNPWLAKAGKLRQTVESIEEQWMEAVEKLETQQTGDEDG